MAKKKHKHEEHVDESWLIPYADMLTLLMALFIVLFAMSSTDASKFKQMAISFNEEFNGGTGDEEFLAEIEAKTEMELQEKEAELNKMVEAKAQQLLKDEEFKKQQMEMENLRKVQEDVEKYIKEKNLSISLKTTLSEHGLMITILDNALFDSAKAEIKPDSLQLAREISNLLVATVPREILISGHTDTDPMYNEEFKSNWELSTMRAVNFLEIILDNKSLDPNKFSAIGHGEFRPMTKNDTNEGKSQNRRVEVLVLPLAGN